MTTTNTLTNETTELARLVQLPAVRNNTLDSMTLDLIKMLAPSFHACRWYGLTDPAQAIVLMTKAVELSIPYTAAFDFFDIIEGRPTLKPKGALALIYRSRLVDVVAIDQQPDRCSITMRRRDQDVTYTSTFTVEDAKRAGLIKPDKDGAAWNRWLPAMLYNRALGQCCRTIAPDVLGGLYLTTDLANGATAGQEVVDAATGEIIEVVA